MSTATTVTRDLVLTAVYCRNGLCPYVLKKGHKILVGRLSGVADLRCPSCHNVTRYEA